MRDINSDSFVDGSDLIFHWEVPTYLQLQPRPGSPQDLASRLFARKRLVFASEEVAKQATIHLQISDLVDLALTAMSDSTADPYTTAGYWVERLAIKELAVSCFCPQLVNLLCTWSQTLWVC